MAYQFNQSKVEELLKLAKTQECFVIPEEVFDEDSDEEPEDDSVLIDEDDRYRRIREGEVVEISQKMFDWITEESCGQPQETGDAEGLGVLRWCINTEIPDLFEGGTLCWYEKGDRYFAWSLSADELYDLADLVDEDGDWIED